VVEQFICNDQVVGSNPTTGSIILLYKDGAVAQRLEQGTHNPLVVGSIPTGPTQGRKCGVYFLFFALCAQLVKEISTIAMRDQKHLKYSI